MSETEKTANVKQEREFSKSQILRSRTYRNYIDLLGATLEEDKKYTKGDVDKIVNQYMKGKVR